MMKNGFSQGTYAKAKDQACEPCQEGKVQSEKGQESCSNCPDGEVPDRKSMKCVKCGRVS